MLKIALLGGTFNPIHWGHIRIAKALLRHGKFDHFYFVPCVVSGNFDIVDCNWVQKIEESASHQYL